jgi:hypothetical protein
MRWIIAIVCASAFMGYGCEQGENTGDAAVGDGASAPDAIALPEAGTDASTARDASWGEEAGPRDAASPPDGSKLTDASSDVDASDDPDAATVVDASDDADAAIASDAGDSPDAALPPPTCNDSGWVSVSVGTNHACGIRADRTLWCWGEGQYGERGDGTTDAVRAYPVQVLAADEASGESAWSDWTAVSAGLRGTCGIRENGTLWCWGSWRGDDIGGDRPTPARVLAEGESAGGEAWSDWVSVDRWQSSYGIRQDGSLWRWLNQAPTRVVGDDGEGETLNDWASVSVGHHYVCALATNDSLWCWGNGGLSIPLTFDKLVGRLGNGTCDDRATPDRVLASGEPPGGAAWVDWVGVWAGGVGTYGQRADGSLWRWGGLFLGGWGSECPGPESDEYGELVPRPGPAGDWIALTNGSGGTVGNFAQPITESIDTCGIQRDNSLWCWGAGHFGELGDGGTASAGAPRRVLANDEPSGGAAWDDWTTISRGGFTACGTRSDGSLWCWGRGDSGQRGDGSTELARTTPAPVLDGPPECLVP